MSAKRDKPNLRDRIGRDSLFQVSFDLPRIVEIDVQAIRPNPEQPRARLDEDGLAELKASIERHGLLQPILVQALPEGYQLIAGQRRLEAVRALGRATVAAVTVSGDPGELALVENLQRQDLDPFEEARAVARLMQRHGYNQVEVGAIIGRKQTTVSALLALNRLPDRIKSEYAQTKSLSRSQLIELSLLPQAARQLEVWDDIKDGRLTVRDLRAERRIDERRTRKPSTRAATAKTDEPMDGEVDHTVKAFETLLLTFRRSPERLDGHGALVERLRAVRRSLGALLDQ